MLDRDQLREATEQWGPRPKPSGFGLSDNQALLILEAARLVADPDTLIISKQDGEWSEETLQAVWDQLAEHPMPAQLLDALLEGQHDPR